MVHWVRALLSLVAVAALFWVIPFWTVWESLRHVTPVTWIAALAIFLCGHWLNAAKLRLFLGPDRVPLSSCVQAQYVGLAANLGLPGIAGGDLVRAAYLVPSAGPKRVAVGSIADRLLDTASLLVLIAIATPIAGLPDEIADVVREGGWWALGGLLAVGLIAAAVAVAARHSTMARAVATAPAELRLSGRSVLVVVAISLGVQTAFVLTNVWIGTQAGVEVAVAAWYVAWPLSKLVAVLPISLGGLGVREAALVTLLLPYGAAGDAVLASGLLWQSILAVSALLGLAIARLLRRRPTTGGASAERLP